ncbi:MAG: T9SS type A sorting domain-containing protein [Crocinitomix sp.]|nr:T9SS type A sorting domain-containing protein [Crocinitomix sp.]
MQVDSAGCLGSDTILVTAHPDILIDLGEDTILCGGEILFLDALNDGAEFLWNTGETTQIIEIASSGNYWVNVSNDYCDGKDSIHVTLVDCASITETNNSVITIFPNPFNAYTTVYFPEEFSESHAIIIHDILGKEIYRIENLTGSSINIGKEHFASGTYILSIVNYSNQEIIAREKLISQ